MIEKWQAQINVEKCRSYYGLVFPVSLFKTIPYTKWSVLLTGIVRMNDSSIYKKLLGILLLFPIARFLFLPNADPSEMKESKLVPSLIIGGIIGLLSGMIGIGGGQPGIKNKTTSNVITSNISIL